jgi:hexosaminidase
MKHSININLFTMFKYPKQLLHLIFILIGLALTTNSWAIVVNADDLRISWEMIENNVNNENKFKSKFVLVNKGKDVLDASNWAIYFNFGRKLKNEPVSGKVAISHVNGDLFKITPLTGFKLKGGDSLSITFMSSYWVINESDAPTGIYIVFTEPYGRKELKTAMLPYSIKPFLKEAQYKRFKGDSAASITPAYLFNQNKIITKINKDQLLPLIPSPNVCTFGTTITLLDPSFNLIAAPNLINEKENLSKFLNVLFQTPLNGRAKDKTIILQIGTINDKNKVLKKGDEAYQLEIKGGKITITGTEEAGVFYGIQTLKALIPVEYFTTKSNIIRLTETTIIDYPRFHYRGMMLDVARNFQKKETILKYLDLLSFYKINKFHFHLTDDEGWRLEIKPLPELTDIGGKRGHDATGKGMLPSFSSGPSNSSNGSGFYTRADFIEIIKYAKARHIEVIPEIDVPGHSRAAIKAMDARFEKFMKEGKSNEATKYLLRDLNDQSNYASVQMWNDNVICICQPSALNFVEEVVKEIVAMYKEANVDISSLHIGGDEVPQGVWQKSSVCKQLLEADATLQTTEELPMDFLKKINNILTKYQLKTAGWEEIALKKTGNLHVVNPDFVKSNVSPYIWNNLWGSGLEDNAYKLANLGYKVVLSNVTHLYFDLAYNSDPAELGDYWGGYVDTRKPFEFIPYDLYKNAYYDAEGNLINQEKYKGKEALTEDGKANILGIQGQLWSENVVNSEIMDYLSFPRIISLAERAWSSAPAWSTIADENLRNKAIDKDWNIFANTIGQKELVRLNNFAGGVAYRISLPGAKIENGILNANIEFPGLTIRYTLDGEEPTTTSTIYTGPIAVSGNVKMKAFANNGRSSRTIFITKE